MIKSILAAALVAGVIGGATQVQAAPAQPAVAPQSTSLAQPVYWARDRYGRPFWVPGPRFYAPPVFYRPGWRWEHGHRRWYR